jgi:preprotein translocase subunit SecB
MTDPGKLPTSGYTFDMVYTNHQSLRVVAKEPGTVFEPGVIFGWDWRRLTGSQFEVTLQFGVDPSSERPEEIRVTLSGRFTAAGPSQEVPLESFVRFHAPAILMPFVRDAVAALTARGFFGTFLLPPINVQSLMDRQDPAATTASAQLRGALPAGSGGGVTPFMF